MNTKVTIAGVTLNNPVMTASGTFGSGMEYSDFVDLSRKFCEKVRQAGLRIVWDPVMTEKI